MENVNEKLVNEYINSLSQKVNELQQENLLLKARLNYQKTELESEQMGIKLELQQARDKIAKLETTKVEAPKVKEEKPATKKPATPKFTGSSFKEVEEPKKRVKPLVKAPKPKGWNSSVDLPRELIPNPKFEDGNVEVNK